MRYAVSLFVLPFILFLTGCGDNGEAIVYTASKETPVQPAPQGQPAPAGMQGRTLPADALNTGGGNPDWQVPSAWAAGSGSAMRRASFTASGPDGPADIAVTSFPGDVGGLLANINRWRGQIGLQPVGPDTLESAITREPVGNKEAILTLMVGSNQSTHAAIFEDNGNSWFIKMTGPAQTVEAQGPDFLAFVRSVRFPESTSQ